MKKRPRRWLMIETDAAFSLRHYDLEVIGAALLIVAWEGAGHTAEEDRLAMVCGLSKTKWRKRGPMILAARADLKRGSFLKNTVGRWSLSKATRERILSRDGEVCCYCGDTEGPFHIDHVVPVARGGNDDDDNLCVACAPCNFAKSASLNSEWCW